ncbi:MAG: FecR domain-containing protein [Pseudomonadota bacterium]
MKPSDQQRADELREQAHLWRMRLADPETAGRWQRDFDQWLDAHPDNPTAYTRAVTVWQALGSLDEQILEQETVPVDALTSGSGPNTGLLRTGAGAKVYFAIAACLLAFVGWWATTVFITSPTPAARVYATETGEIRQFTLADGSLLILAPDSRVTMRMELERRRAHLEHGEALFDVVSNSARPFEVATGPVTVMVVGTVFEVRNSGGVSRVAVAEGKVMVTQRGARDPAGISSTQQIEVMAGQRVIAAEGSELSNPSHVSPESIAAWRNSRLVYENATLSELIDDANRYSKRPIVLDRIQPDTFSDTVTASFDSNDIDALLATLPALFPVALDLEDPERIVIRVSTGP